MKRRCGILSHMALRDREQVQTKCKAVLARKFHHEAELSLTGVEYVDFVCVCVCVC